MLEWNVYYHNSNKDEIEIYNALNQGICREISKIIKTNPSKEKFSEELKYLMMYYFWCRAEWEILISPWVGSRSNEPIKIDVFSQVEINWNIFVDYVWDNKDKLELFNVKN